MRFLALACDYDGTLAHAGRLADETRAAVAAVRDSGRKLLVVTGRERPDLEQAAPGLDLFDLVVAENGAVLYWPRSGAERLLAPAPPPAFVAALQRQGVAPLGVGRCIVSTVHPHEHTVLDTIRQLGLELEVIFNQGAVMVLPVGVNKATGLAAALAELGLSPHNAIGVGDAENDHAFLAACECGVALGNAVPMLKERADVVVPEPNGAGVRAIAAALLADDLAAHAAALGRHEVPLGMAAGAEERLRAHGPSVLCAGPSGSGKSTFALGLLDRLAQRGYQFCLVDPEGDYVGLRGAVSLGDTDHVPRPDEILRVLADPAENVVVNLLGVKLADRPVVLAGLLSHLQALRVRTGRPHWLVLDEAHHLVPAGWDPAPSAIPQALPNVIFVTVHPDRVARAALRGVDTVVAVGDAPETTVRAMAEVWDTACPPVPARGRAGDVILWRRGAAPLALTPVATLVDRQRHRRKYAHGELGADASFYFRGADGRLNLRAQNLVTFLQLAAGVDDATWLHHLRQGDYSRWFRATIKDEELAAVTARIEAEPGLGATETRARIRAAVEERYTAPA